ncbi:glycosyltransferase involved in cell wall biosynthesis [Litorivivens lipolytica]|uniref:tRNA-queuosine alpha-mannosyltransferase n=1 Tax=Litorivivens lipolytica TaxID=1524264 RepID=A0A7W4Z4A6_9GAMM|nr:DUF3524 domain-containing protein [Litorivivens lipolytica]MBB3045842.1 glycosyltransferase involved in cell wall biosynthesis [Litorivivens lipolytica]
MRILVLSAYHAASHDYWLQGMMTALPEYQWDALTLPPRYFNWRIRGNPLSWLSSDQTQLHARFDLIIATSTVDIATLRGLVPAWRNVPWVAYFHENQFAYPPSPEGAAQQRVEPQMVNLYAALAADALWFNSQFNLDTLLAGCEALCRKLPDQVPAAGWFKNVRARAQVLPVPLVRMDSPARVRGLGEPLRVVWNHRWEYDKGVDRLLALVSVLNKRKVSLQLTVLGQRFRKIPPAMEALLALPQGSVTVTCPEFIADREEYLALLQKQDVVLSTSLHDFQGLSIMEAVQAGCVPLLPDRLCYPEFFNEAYRYPGFKDDSAAESEALADQLSRWAEWGLPPAPDIFRLSWEALEKPYRQAIGQALGNNFG